MTEVLLGHDLIRSPLDPEKVSENSLKSGNPRSEFFLMTGDKIINLNHKISPRYAEMHCEQLPPTTEKADLPAVRKPFDDFPSTMQENSRNRRFNLESAVPASQSENGLHEEEYLQDIEIDDKNSSVTVNIDRNNRSCTAEASGSPVTWISNALSSHYSNSAAAPRSPKTERENAVVSRSFESSRSEPNSPSKASVPVINNFVSTIRCSSPTDYNKRSEFDVEVSVDLAKRLFVLDGFKSEEVAAHLSKINEFGKSVAEEYCALFNFSGIRLDAALRDFLSRFCLTGGTQERTHITEHFAKRYYECNPTLFRSADQVYALTCALLLLNSDLHGPNVGRRMSSRDFVDNLSHTEHIFDCSLLKTLYIAIKEQPIKWVGELEGTSFNDVSMEDDIASQFYEKKKKKMLSKSRSTVSDDDQIEYKAGWVVRKCLFDRDGKRTPFGRRGWKMVYARLRGMVLYLHKDENGFRRDRFQTFNNAILLHHALAEKPEDYCKRQHIFKLRTANLDSLQAEQLKAHEKKEAEMRLKLEELMKTAPSLKAKGRVVQDFFCKERFLYQERERYQRYVEILRENVNALSPSHFTAIRVEPIIGIYRVGDTARSSSVTQSKIFGYTSVVKEEAEAEAKAEKAEELESDDSDASAGRCSYQEAIQQNPGPHLIISK
ncbi:unnamed protein product [Onchocerca flexuosa]|uniref:SEC7 domain-containing protein n=1 Tax=Onchocerca flexuosa TaxID=387005 RepID=A0A183I0C7_9BILA|nr:unnamed protein product [Onchocerca flexuosa]